ncbi:hypothetical protein MMC30_007199 [Trapelia coarctata]|nr:hypothetical protein [Trapelia coarctata]
MTRSAYSSSWPLGSSADAPIPDSILEKQVQALKAAFENAHPTPNTPCSMASARSQKTSHGVEFGMPADSSPHSSIAHTVEPDDHESPAWEPDLYSETILGCTEFDSLSFGTTVELFADFVLHALPEYRVLVFADSDNFESLRTNKPILLFAVVTAASRAKDPTLFENLHTRLLRLLTDKVIINGERSVELLQAVLVTEVWYNPPDDLGRLNFYLWIQIAGTMALQLGLWWDPRMLSAVTNMEADDRTMDRWRTALAFYLSVSTVAVSSR